MGQKSELTVHAVFYYRFLTVNSGGGIEKILNLAKERQWKWNFFSDL